MNKKVKITLLSLMLGASLAGIATTIVSCSASSSNELQIEKSSTLEKDVTDSLTEILNNDQDYLAKRDTYNKIISDNQLPESTLTTLKRGITFKNDGNTISWDDAVSSLKIDGPQFTQVAKGDIAGISIELEINDDYVVLGSSLSNLKFSTGTLGNVGTIPILSIGESTDRQTFLKDISTKLTMILEEEKKSYQEMRQTYESWISDPKANLPNSIWTAFNNNFTFTMPGGTTLSFRNIVDNLLFEPETNYPSGVDQKVPNFSVTIVLVGDGYEFINPEEQAKLKIGNIQIDSNTKKIDTSIAPNKNNIESTFKKYLNPESIPNRNIYQDVKIRFNDILDPAKLPSEIKNAIVNNIGLELFGYEGLSFDQVFKSIEITGEQFPKTPNAPLPNLRIDFTTYDIYQNIDSSLNVPIIIDLSDTTSGSIKYDVSIDQNLSTQFKDILSNEIKIAKTWQEINTIYNSWSSFNNLPTAAQQLIRQGITFNAIGLQEGDVTLSPLNDFDTVIDNISINKEQLPEYGQEIGSVDLDLNMNDDALYFDSSNNYQNKIQIQSGSIGNADKPVLLDIQPNLNMNMVVPEIQKLISKDTYIENKDEFDSWKVIDDFGPEITNLFKRSINIKSEGYPKTLTWDDVVNESLPATIIKDDGFPTITDMKITNVYVVMHFKDEFRDITGSNKGYVIPLDGLFSRGIYEIKPTVKKDPTADFETYSKNHFTEYFNSFLIEDMPPDADTTTEAFAWMKLQYGKLTSQTMYEKIKAMLINEISFKGVHDNVIDINLANFASYFNMRVIPGSPIPNDHMDSFPAVTIEIRLLDSNSFVWSDNSKILKIETNPLKSANDIIPNKSF